MIRAWFPLFPADWLADEDITDMTLAEEGAYHRLLCFQWREGSIPADPKRLQRMLRCTAAELRKVWPKVSEKFAPLEKNPDRLSNERLAREYGKALELSEKAKKNAAKRWESQERDDAVALPSQSDGNASPHDTRIPHAGDCECDGDGEASALIQSASPNPARKVVQAMFAGLGVPMPDAQSLLEATNRIESYANAIGCAVDADLAGKVAAAFQRVRQGWSTRSAPTPQLLVKHWDAIQAEIAGTVVVPKPSPLKALEPQRPKIPDWKPRRAAGES